MRYQVYIEGGGSVPDLPRGKACALRQFLIRSGYKAHVKPEGNGTRSETK